MLVTEEYGAVFRRPREFYIQAAAIVASLAGVSSLFLLSTKRTTDEVRIGSLVNVGGNGCFVNAILQLLSSSYRFIHLLRKSDMAINHELGELLHSLNVSCKVINPRNVLDHLYSSFKLPSLWQQQDSHEFLIQLLDQMSFRNGRAGLLQDRKYSVLDELRPYESMLAHSLRCIDCGHDSGLTISMDSIIHLSTIESTVRRTLRSFLQWESIHGPCLKCGQLGLKRKWTILRPAKTLIMHFNRVKMNNGQIVRDRTKVRLNPRLAISGHKYRLKAWVEHRGAVKSGHYFTVKSHNGKWYKLSDSSCTVFDSIDEPQEPYLCLYEQE